MPDPLPCADLHDYLHAQIDARQATPMQRKLRQLAPMPIGVVFLPWPGMTEEDARAHFRLMRSLGITCLKQTMPTPEWPRQRTEHLALDEGIIPFWYAEGGYAEITPQLLETLGLPRDLGVDAALAHPKMIAHQHALLRARIDRGRIKIASHSAADAAAKDWVPSVIGSADGHVIAAEAIPAFLAFLRQEYGTPQALWQAWNGAHVGIEHGPWADWAAVEAAWRSGAISNKDYRHHLDAIRFRAGAFIEHYVAAKVAEQQRVDAAEPVRAGGEMGLFLSFAARATDMEGIAAAMAEGGSFYPSIHLTWHFEEVAFEVARPIYLQAAIAADWAKGIWSAPWESTGGPNYFSGGKAPFVPAARDQTPGFTCDAGTMTQLMLSYIAAGFRGVGLWAWNYRTAGWEAGEFAILDRNREPGERAQRIGAIGRAMVEHRRELWQARKEPYVGVLQDFAHEAMWAAMATVGRDKYANEGVRARIGIGRALIDANVPWEHVTVRDLRAGLGPRYRVIVVPAFIALSDELLALLTAYARAGGRVVMDMPSGYYDDYGRIRATGPGSAFAQLFGAVVHEFAYSNDVGQRWTIAGDAVSPAVPIDGFTALVSPLTARVIARFTPHAGPAGHAGHPAITEHAQGRGSAVLLAFQASLTCCRPGHTALQDLLVRAVLGPYRSPIVCAGALAYRLVAPAADHYFLINPDPPKQVRLIVHDRAAATGPLRDVLTGEAIDLAAPIALDGHSGRWLRVEKKLRAAT